jgi:DNA mismatch repair protein MutS
MTSSLAHSGSASKKTAPKSTSGGVTPMMAQYWDIKDAHADYMLFYRMGDFYELFFEDAEVASEALAITLTKRGKHAGEEIPMCGVPVHAADQYLEQLIRKGFKVAVCEQLESPAEAKKRGAKSVVKRGVVRLVTAGTLTEDTLLDARTHNFLAAVATLGTPEPQNKCAIAWADMSTGDFRLMECLFTDLAGHLARLAPREVLVPDRWFENEYLTPVLDDLGGAATPLPGSRFNHESGARRLRETFDVSVLEGFGDFSKPELAAGGALVDYIALTQKGRMPALRTPLWEETSATLLLDAATRANLELVRTLSGQRQGSLLATIDKTVTGAGARELARRLSSPLTCPLRINARLDAVAAFVENRPLREDLRRALREVPDLARALSRLSLGRGGPRDLGAIRDGLIAAKTIAQLIEGGGQGLSGLPEDIAAAVEALAGSPKGLEVLLHDALDVEVPALARDGGFIKKAYNQDLDEARLLRDESRRVIVGLQDKYQGMTDIRALKIKHNNVLGYFIEVTERNAGPLESPPHAEIFIHRQTLASNKRFTTVELNELEARIREAGDRALRMEMDLFTMMVEEVGGVSSQVGEVAEALAALDVMAALSELAESAGYMRPQVDGSRAFAMKGGRHPVVEAALARDGDTPFVANDCDLSADQGAQKRLWLVTGPNMAGKSTFLRQNALIAIMAQMGSFVPATEAHLGVVDRLFSRVGAADDLARGRSTFMVEMVETAAILNQAGPNALVILDEIGRGTATFDGLSIAWAALENLHDVNACRGLFATHYHELTALASKLPGLGNLTVKVKEWKGDVVFLHEVTEGAADRSYGIQVAKLAGLPAPVIARAGQVLETLEKGRASGKAQVTLDDLPLFSAVSSSPSSAAGSSEPSAVETALDEIDPDTMSPRDALAVLYELKGKIEK